MTTTDGTGSLVIERPVGDVFAAVADITRMGEWSPECVGARWVDPATGPAIGARFEGDNVAAVGPITLKRWTTTSEVTGYRPDELFEFVTEGHTTWRYEFADRGGSTLVIESFAHPPHVGWQRFVYGILARRRATMVKGIHATLGRIKQALESAPAADRDAGDVSGGG